jgi:hypothetical protein
MHTFMICHLLLKILPLMTLTLSLERMLQLSNCISSNLLDGYRIIRVLLPMVRVNISISMPYRHLFSKI